QLRDLTCAAAHDRQFRARRVILFEFADPVEERRSPLIIEKFARKLLLSPAKAALHFGAEIVPPRLEIVEPQELSGLLFHTSLARRIPMNCQRASGAKKLR